MGSHVLFRSPRIASAVYDRITTCNAHQGRCSAESVPECSNTAQEFQHTCEQVGIFPDAYDCRKFHLCSPPEGMPDGRPADHREALCPRHYAYNPQTAQCSIQLQNGQCNERTVPECKSIGQNGVLPSSTNHYYVCLMKNQELHPQIFICPHGWHFWGGFCQPEPEVKENIAKDVKDGLVKDDQDKNKEVTTENKDKNKEATEKTIEYTEKTEAEITTPRIYAIESFFSTEKPPTYAADTFLADRFDLSNYESTDDVQPSRQDDFINSFEDGNEFW